MKKPRTDFEVVIVGKDSGEIPAKDLATILLAVDKLCGGGTTLVSVSDIPDKTKRRSKSPGGRRT